MEWDDIANSAECRSICHRSCCAETKLRVRKERNTGSRVANRIHTFLTLTKIKAFHTDVIYNTERKVGSAKTGDYDLGGGGLRGLCGESKVVVDVLSIQELEVLWKDERPES